MKKVYVAPQTEIVKFESENMMQDVQIGMGVLVGSGGNGGYNDMF